MTTNEDIMKEIKSLRNEINRLYEKVDTVRAMIYDTNSDFYDTWQITCSDRNANFKPLTNRELLLYMMDKYPMEDVTTGREKLLTKEEIHEQHGEPIEWIMHNFEIKQGEYIKDNPWYTDDFEDEDCKFRENNSTDGNME